MREEKRRRGKGSRGRVREGEGSRGMREGGEEEGAGASGET